MKGGFHQGGKTPNWYIYWKADSAVPNMEITAYDPESTYYGHYDANTGKVFLTQYSADQHYPQAIVLGLTGQGTSESFGGPTVTGIDCTAEIIAHELYHKWVDVDGNLEDHSMAGLIPTEINSQTITKQVLHILQHTTQTLTVLLG